jgi:hypothetical protein
MNERFSELLPWYVNGTLSAEDRAWVDRYLAEHPAARAELEWFQSLQTRIHENVPPVPATIGLAKAMKLIRGDRPTFAERISAFFSDFGMRPAVALGMFAIFAVQGVIIFNQMQQVREDEVEIRALRAKTVEEGPLLKVNFAPEAKEADIRFLLVSVQGTVTGGPGQLGDWFVRVPPGKEAEVAKKLEGKQIVQAIELVPGIPPRD